MATTFHKTGAMRFRIADVHLQTQVRRPAPVLRAPVRPQQVRPGWIERIGALLSRLLGLDAPAPIAVGAPPPETADALSAATPGARPTHYHAFSLLQPRLRGDTLYGPSHPAVVAFRTRAKLIKNQDQGVRDAACAVLDAFVALVDAFTPLWDAAGDAEGLLLGIVGAGDRIELRDEMLTTIARLDAELQRILAPRGPSHDRFDTVQRFIETRYGGKAGDGYNLAPVD